MDRSSEEARRHHRGGGGGGGKDERRLNPDASVPILYTVALSAEDLGSSETFHGSVEVELDLLRGNDDSVTFNLGSGLRLEEETIRLTMRSSNESDLEITGIQYDPEHELCSVYFVRPEARSYSGEDDDIILELSLYVSFTGLFRDDGYGFYLDSNNIATTQFEPSFARDAFPCWDEPEFKGKC